MPIIDVAVRGLIETQRNLTKAAEELHGKPVMDGMQKATLLVQRDAKKNAPVFTGLLRASINSEVRVNGLGGTTVTGVVGSNKVYAAAVELGSRPHFPPLEALRAWAQRHNTSAFLVARAISRRGTKPRRYLQRAFESNQPVIIRILDGAVAEIVKKANG